MNTAEDFQRRFMEAEKSLYLVAIGYLHSTEDARDAVQDTAETAFRSFKGLRDKCYFKTWITRILINKCKDFIRKRRFTEELTDDCGIFSEIPVEDICLMDAICRLEPDQARLITLRYYGDMTYEEMARALKMPTATVKYKTKKALKNLKNLWEGEDEE